MKKIKTFVSLLLVTALCFSFTACTKSNKQETTGSTSGTTETGKATPSGDTASAIPETTIKIRLMNEVVGIDKVVNEFYKRVADDPVLSKVKLDISYVLGADYTDKLTLAITAQEDYDAMFVGAWQGLNDKARDGVFKDLSSYFNNDAYPGLQSAFSEDYIKSNSINGGVYAIPITETFEDIKGIVYREDLRKKYNLPAIVDYETYEQYLQGISEHLEDEGLVSAWGVSSLQGMSEFKSLAYAGLRKNIYYVSAGPLFYVALNEDGTKVLDAAVDGDDTSHWAKFPEPFNYDYQSERYIDLNNYTKYINSDAISSTDDVRSSFKAGLYAATYSTATEYLTYSDIADTIPNAELGFFILDDAQRSFEPGAIVSNMTAWNFLCVPSWSTKTDAVMAFLDWLWSSKENHDLFQYGIQGEDWEPIGDNAYRILNAESYKMPGYSFSWNPTYVRYVESVINNDYMTKVFDYMYDMDTYSLGKLAGFSFGNSTVETEMATMSTYSSDYKFSWAAYGDKTADKIKEYHDALVKAGLEKVRAELITQVQAFLDAR